MKSGGRKGKIRRGKKEKGTGRSRITTAYRQDKFRRFKQS